MGCNTAFPGQSVHHRRSSSPEEDPGSLSPAVPAIHKHVLLCGTGQVHTDFGSGRLYALFAVMERALLNMALSRLSAMSFLP